MIFSICRNLKWLNTYVGKEVILEYVMFLLHQGNLQQAKMTFQVSYL